MTNPDPIDLIARAIVGEFPTRSQPDNDDFVEARRYAEAALLAIESAYWLSPKPRTLQHG